MPADEMIALHTPGPWEIDEGDGMPIAKVSFHAITAPCMANIGTLSREEIHANARVIAASPDLLDGLKALVRVCLSQPGWGTVLDTPEFTDALAAIAKADGQ